MISGSQYQPSVINRLEFSKSSVSSPITAGG